MVKGIKVGWPPLNSGLYGYKKTLRDVTKTAKKFDFVLKLMLRFFYIYGRIIVKKIYIYT